MKARLLTWGSAVKITICTCDRHSRLFILALVATWPIAFLTAWAFAHYDSKGIGDWFGIWSAPVIARSSSAASLYDEQGLHAAQVALGLPADRRFPFPYPPTFLAMLWPLGNFSIGVAFVVFMAASFALYLIASTDRWRTIPVVAFNPAVGINLIAGQSGFLSGGLMLGATRLLTTCPVVAGALFGLLTYKPQLGIMVPVALLAARQWTCLASAMATTVLMIVGAYWCFGAGAWVACWQSLGDYVSQSDASTHIRMVSPTVSAMLRNMGTSYGVAACVQAAAATASTAAVWVSWRQFDPRNPQPAVLALCAATFLATPHALFYDLTMLSGALILYVMNCRTSLRIWETALILVGIALPATSVFLANVDPLVLAAILWMACTAPERRLSSLANETQMDYWPAPD
jgi:hypothetical protein